MRDALTPSDQAGDARPPVPDSLAGWQYPLVAHQVDRRVRLRTCNPASSLASTWTSPQSNALRGPTANSRPSWSSADLAIFSIDLAGQIVNWNSGAERIFGYSGEEIAGSHVHVLAPADHRRPYDGI